MKTLNQISESIEENLEEAKSPWKRYEELEDQNRHSENVIHMAKHVGSEKDVEQAKSIHKRHLKQGYLTDELAYERYELNKKLWGKFYNKFAPKETNEMKAIFHPDGKVTFEPNKIHLVDKDTWEIKSSHPNKKAASKALENTPNAVIVSSDSYVPPTKKSVVKEEVEGLKTKVFTNGKHTHSIFYDGKGGDVDRFSIHRHMPEGNTLKQSGLTTQQVGKFNARLRRIHGDANVKNENV